MPFFAGDAFVGGFLSRLVATGGAGAAGGDSDGDSSRALVRECVVEGHRCAGLVLRRRGCSLEVAAGAARM